MAKKKTPGGTAGKGGVNPAPTRDDQTVRIAAEQLTMVPIDDLTKLFPKEEVAAGNWQYITDKCKEALGYIAEARV